MLSVSAAQQAEDVRELFDASDVEPFPEEQADDDSEEDEQKDHLVSTCKIRELIRKLCLGNE